MRKLLVTLLLIPVLAVSSSGQPDSVGFKNDLRIFKKVLEETHPNLYGLEMNGRITHEVLAKKPDLITKIAVDFFKKSILFK